MRVARIAIAPSVEEGFPYFPSVNAERTPEANSYFGDSGDLAGAGGFFWY